MTPIKTTMPAAERAFGDALPRMLYPDTDFLISTIFTNQPHHQRSRALVERLLFEGRTALVVSSLLWTEFAHSICKEGFRLALEAREAQAVAPRRWQRRIARQRYLRCYVAQRDGILAQFNWIEVPLDETIRRAAVDLMARHALGSQGTVHVATAFAAGTPHLASFDAAYRRVDGLALWNDRVHRRASEP